MRSFHARLSAAGVLLGLAVHEPFQRGVPLYTIRAAKRGLLGCIHLQSGQSSGPRTCLQGLYFTTRHGHTINVCVRNDRRGAAKPTRGACSPLQGRCQHCWP